MKPPLPRSMMPSPSPSGRDADEKPDFEGIAETLGYGPLKIDPGRTSLLVIDMQRYFVEPEHPFGRTWSKVLPGGRSGYFDRVREIVIPNIQRLLASCRAENMPVYFTGFGSIREDGRDLAPWAQRANALSRRTVGAPMYPHQSDPSWAIHDSLLPAPGEEVLAKTTSGPLNSTKLDQTLRLMGIDTVIVTGVATDICVTQTAREFGDRGFLVVVPEDACATLSEEAHHAALQAFALVFGRVSTVAALIPSLAGASPSTDGSL